MKRELNMNEISDGKLYESGDMVKLGSEDCKDCYSCCVDMGKSIILDPYDIYRLSKNLNTSFEGMIGKYIELNIVDGLILPNLKMSEDTMACEFLDKEGRCSIHEFRPGFCRLFPLGRIYEDGDFKYFLQIHECKKKNRTKVKISKWIGEADLKRYEKFVKDWHYFLNQLEEGIQIADNEDVIKSINMNMLKNFYMHPYEYADDFFQQFYRILDTGYALIQKKKEEYSHPETKNS